MKLNGSVEILVRARMSYYEGREDSDFNEYAVESRLKCEIIDSTTHHSASPFAV